ncbi:site-specific recombinase XerD [Motilibacter rhizosphaerae]|uniref:Site-specific recombinase XerD n=1 Tax=Motilibacter rhizosphaerae TaxID=598652 RepID=A0A4Q7NSW7_9ACTN|nr:site-specific integrase [Motilibacter rhizosphaerae]RZS89878.1 site-specific recombinase XerD [Motilibacter rhizosphaerae]
MASATKRGSGYLGRYRGPDGKERSKTFDRKGDALRWAQEQERKVRNQDWADPALAKVTVGELCEHWLATLSVKPKTRLSYENLLTTAVLPTWGTVRVDRVTHSAVRAWVAGMTGARGLLLSASRRRQAYNLLASVLDAAVLDGRLTKNPARPADVRGRRANFLPKVEAPARKRYLTHEQVAALADAAGEYRPLMLVLAYCGLRWGEASALRVRHVDLLRKRLLVEEAVADIRGKLIYDTTKTRTSRRTVAVPPFLLADFERLMQDKGPNDLLFTSPQGSALRLPNWRKRVFDKAVIAAGLEGLTPHGLRHTAASLAVQSGANVKVVQAMLGHKDAAMTLNVYADLFDQDLDDVAARLDAAYRDRQQTRNVVRLTGTAGGA